MVMRVVMRCLSSCALARVPAGAAGCQARARRRARAVQRGREGRTSRLGGDADRGIDLDRERIVNSEQGRRGWFREGRRQLDELRREQARPIARSQAGAADGVAAPAG